jgi:cellulose synthase/poly-beta-1,6-N-acetylglucosamine synthase-like glycosyltransferase
VINWLLALVLSVVGLVPVTYLLTNAYLSRRRARVLQGPPSPPESITIVIPVYGEEPQRFRSSVRSAVRQGCRVIVVGDGCSEPYRSIAHSEGAEFVALPQRGGKKQALAAGLARVSTPFVLFVDSDTWIPDGAAAALSSYFADDVGGVGANLLHRDSDSIAAGASEFVERAREVVLRAMSSRGNVLYLDGACMMFRTELIRPFVASESFQHLRIFGRETSLGDDWLLTDHVLGRGYRTVKAYDVGAVTHPPESVGGFVRQNVRWMRSSWIRLGQYLRGAGPRDPGLFYRLELIGTYSLPLVTLALAIARFPMSIHLFDHFAGAAYLWVTTGSEVTRSSVGALSWHHLLLPIQTAAGLVGTGAFIGAVVNRLPPQRRLRTLACGVFGSGLLLVSAIYGLVTVWRTTSWRDSLGRGLPGVRELPPAASDWAPSPGPYLRR